MDKLIKDTWIASGYPSPAKLWQKLKDDGHKVTLKQVVTVLSKEKTVQVVKKVKKPTKFNTIVAPKKKFQFQMDIMYMPHVDKGKRYILTCIDVHTRFATAKALTNRSGPTILRETKAIFKQMGVPTNINVDNEFNYKEWMAHMKSNDVKVYLSHADDVIDSKNSIIERFHRTFRQLVKNFELNTGRKDWATYLPLVLKSYNGQIHRTVKSAPQKIWSGKDENKQTITKVPMRYKVGQLVRIARKPKTFAKGARETYSEEVYRIKEIKGNRYFLTDVKSGQPANRGYKELELSMVQDAIIEPKIIQTRKMTVESKNVSQQQVQKKVDRELRNLKNIGAKSSFDRGVATRQTKRTVPAAKPKEVSFRVGDSVIVRWDNGKEYKGTVKKSLKTYIEVYFPIDKSIAKIPKSKFKTVRKI